MAKRRISRVIRTSVLTEAGYRCAVPTCHTTLAIDLHHMVHVEHGGKDTADNLLALCPTCHALHHRGVIAQESIVAWKQLLRELNRTKREPSAESAVDQPFLVAVRDGGKPLMHTFATEEDRARFIAELLDRDQNTHYALGEAPLHASRARETTAQIVAALEAAETIPRDHYAVLDELEPEFRRAFTGLTLQGTLAEEFPTLSVLIEYAHHCFLSGTGQARRFAFGRECAAKITDYYARNSAEMDNHPIGVKYYHMKASRELIEGNLLAAVASQRRAAELARDVAGLGGLQRLAYQKCVLCMRSELIAHDASSGAAGYIGGLDVIAEGFRKESASGANQRKALYLSFYAAMVQAKVCIYAGWLGDAGLGRHLDEAERLLAERGPDARTDIDRALLNVYRALHLADRDVNRARECLEASRRYWAAVRVRTYCLLRLPDRAMKVLNFLDPGWLPA